VANSKQAAKRAKQAENARQQNQSQRSELRTVIKKVRAAIAAKDKAQATATFTDAQSLIDNYARKGLLHANAAARYKSRLSNQIKGLGA
jgi:small subunit ribosomal protein S20